MTTPFQTALITGASSGLGRGLARHYASRGVTVYAAARRLGALESLRAEVGERIIPLQLDVARADETNARVAELDAKTPLDLVIANAGVGEETSGKRMDWKVVKQTLDVNVSGALATLTGALPGMVARGKGHLVGVASIAGLVALPRMSTYCASKAFLTMWLESLRLDVARLGLHVTTLQPGFVKSEMTAKNKPGSMPFLMETDDAIASMSGAIDRKEQVFAFPWQMKALAHTGAALPRGVRTAMEQKRNRCTDRCLIAS
jgi:short-subunit dehydrogenase